MISTARPAALPTLLLISLGLLLGLWACHLNQEGGTKQVFNLTSLADSLKRYDSVKVYVLDADGNKLDTLYNDPVDEPSDLAGLEASNYKGGRAIVAIEGYDEDVLVLRTERVYGGKGAGVESVLVVLDPSAAVELAATGAEIEVGEEFPLPEAGVSPAILADKSVAWSSTAPAVVRIDGGMAKGLSEGDADLIAALKVDPTRKAVLKVKVKARRIVVPPESLELSPEVLQVTVDGGPRPFTLEAFPLAADKEVTWHSADSTKVRFPAPGQAEGLDTGRVRVWAVSTVAPSVADSAWVEVKAEVKVERVAFKAAQINLFVGGAPESLRVEVEPDLANPEVTFEVEDPAKARIVGGKAEGLQAGETRITAISVQDTGKRASIKAVVVESPRVDRVDVTPEYDTLFAGGAHKALTASISPSTTSQRVQWKAVPAGYVSVDTAGVIRPEAVGKALVIAISVVDSTWSDTCEVLVKRDPPVFSIDEKDTTVSVGSEITWMGTVSQKYGTVTRFEWNLDGDSAWDGSSDTLKPVSRKYETAGRAWARFRIRDTEGNVTLVNKRVNAVTGPVIRFVSPTQGSYVNQLTIPVSWTVNDLPQAVDLSETFTRQGPQEITRSAKDEAGKTYSASITVIVDTEAPGKPAVNGVSPANTLRPRWTWKSGGGGIGTYRVMLQTTDTAKAILVGDTTFVPAAGLPGEGPATLSVQERDSAGNWSETGSHAIRVDTTAPAQPLVTSPAPVTANPRPSWTWSTATGGEPAHSWRYRLDTAAITGGTVTTSLSFTPAADLGESSHTLYVQQRDSAGNWSPVASYAVRIDRTGPRQPVFNPKLLSPLNTLRPTWSWTGGGGGDGTYRFKVGDTTLSTTTPVNATSYTVPEDLAQGNHTLYIQERDSAGNWSARTSLTLELALRDTVGQGGLTTGGAGAMDFTICNDGTPYIAFQDLAKGGKISVMKYSGGLWSYVGTPGFSTYENTGKITIACSPLSNQIAVAYTNYSISEVWRYGTSWVKQGADATLGEALQISISHTGRSTLYAAYTDRTGYLRIDSLDGTRWVSTGVFQGEPGAYASTSADLEMKFIGNMGYVAFADRNAASAPRIGKFRVGTKWSLLPTAGLTADSAKSLDFESIGSGGIALAVAHRNPTSQGAVTYHEIAIAGGTSWSTLGGAITTGLEVSLSTANISPVVAFPDRSNQNKAAVRVWNGTSWISMSGNGLSPSAASSVIVVRHPSSRMPYVAFIEPGNGKKITVMQTSFDPP